jgi:hypothetical protein
MMLDLFWRLWRHPKRETRIWAEYERRKRELQKREFETIEEYEKALRKIIDELGL